MSKQSYVLEIAMNTLIGELLTIADAITSNETQQEAIKSLIKNKVWPWYRTLDKNLFPLPDKDSDVEWEPLSKGQTN